MIRLSLLVAAAAISLAAAAAPSETKDKDQAEQTAARTALARGQILPIVRILTIANRAVPGDVVKVKLEPRNWGWQYEVKILATNGRVREVELDARTGRILEIEDD